MWNLLGNIVACLIKYQETYPCEIAHIHCNPFTRIYFFLCCWQHCRAGWIRLHGGWLELQKIDNRLDSFHAKIKSAKKCRLCITETKDLFVLQMKLMNAEKCSMWDQQLIEYMWDQQLTEYTGSKLTRESPLDGVVITSSYKSIAPWFKSNSCNIWSLT